MQKRLLLSERIRYLTKALLLSAFLNLIFLTIFFYFFIRENPLPLQCDFADQTEPPCEKRFSNQERAHAFYKARPRELFDKLHSTVPLEEGYKERDLALSILASRDHLDVQRALGQNNLSKRLLRIDKNTTLLLFPGLTNDDFAAIITFLSEEKWPLTTQGLFYRLQKGSKNDSSLLLSFVTTTHFRCVEMLFAQCGLPLTRRLLVSLVCEGNWEMLKAYTEEQRKGLDLSAEKRRAFLLTYLQGGSRTAAALLLLLDNPFALKHLDDAQVLKLLSLLPPSSKRAQLFAKTLALSPRSDAVRHNARRFLQGEPLAEAIAPLRATKTLRPLYRSTPPHSPSPSLHIVQRGETLLLIAAKYGVPPELLKAANHLPTNVLEPGKTLIIPRLK